MATTKNEITTQFDAMFKPIRKDLESMGFNSNEKFKLDVGFDLNSVKVI